MRTAILFALLAAGALAGFAQGQPAPSQDAPPAKPAAATPEQGKAALPEPPKTSVSEIASPAAGKGGTPKTTPKGAPPQSGGDETTQDFVLGAQDVITIQVYGEPNFLVKQESVRPDGVISMPLVGELKAMGKTPRALETEIATVLAEKYLRYTPKVYITIDQVKSRYFAINGGVLKPGEYPLLVPTTIMQALVNAGGFKDFADTKKIRLLRDNKVIVVFNFNDAVKGKHPEKNIYLKHGDLIVVKE